MGCYYNCCVGVVVVVALYVLTEDGLNVLLMFLIGIIVDSGAEFFLSSSSSTEVSLSWKDFSCLYVIGSSDVMSWMIHQAVFWEGC